MRYRLEIISVGQTVDVTGDQIHLVDMWSFKLKDPDSLRDWVTSNPLPYDAEMPQRLYEAEMQRRLAEREVWEMSVLSLLTGHTAESEQLTAWTFVQCHAEYFTAMRIRPLEAAS